MNKRLTYLCAAIGLLLLLTCGVFALTAGDSLVSLKYLNTALLPGIREKGEQAANEKLQKTYDDAKKVLDAVQEEYSGQPAAGSYSDSLAARDLVRGDELEFSTGSSALMLAGTASVAHSGVFLDVTDGTEVPSGARLTPNHRYLTGEDTTVIVTVTSGAAQLGIQGNFAYTASGVQTAPFYDVSEGDWFCGPVDYVCRNGLFSGMEVNRFGPGESMTRAMLMTVLYRLAGAPEDERDEADVHFSDVPEDAWYTDYVRWGAAQGITAGTGPDTFSPEQRVTREQIVTLLYSFCANYLELDTSERQELSGYQDLEQASGWAREAFSWAVAKGIVGSTSADTRTLSPRKDANRAEVATMLRAFAENEKIL